MKPPTEKNDIVPVPRPKMEPKDEFLMVAAQMPEFPGGTDSLTKYLNNASCYLKKRVKATAKEYLRYEQKKP